MDFKTWYRNNRELMIKELITIYIPESVNMMAESYEQKIDYDEDLEQLKMYCKVLELFSTNEINSIEQGYKITNQNKYSDDPSDFRIEVMANLK